MLEDGEAADIVIEYGVVAELPPGLEVLGDLAESEALDARVDQAGVLILGEAAPQLVLVLADLLGHG